jgi:hypothetical protein
MSEKSNITYIEKKKKIIQYWKNQSKSAVKSNHCQKIIANGAVKSKSFLVIIY